MVTKESLQETFFPGVEKIDTEFCNRRLDYTSRFPPSKSQFHAWRNRIREGKEIAVNVQLNLPSYITGLGPSSLDEVYVLLGKRTGVSTRWGANTWAPVMGRIELSDLRAACYNSKLLKGKYSLGDLITMAAYREYLEEVSEIPAQTTMLFAEPSLHKTSGKTIHVIAQVVQAVSQGYGIGNSFWEQVGPGKRPFMKSPKPRSLEHSEFRWFRFGELPLSNMDLWSQRAIKKAVQVAIEKKYIKFDPDGLAKILGLSSPKIATGFLLGENSTGDEVVDFYTDSFPYLYASFYRWYLNMLDSAPDQVKKYINPATNDRVALFNERARGFLSLGQGLYDYKEVLKHFSVNFEGAKIPQTIEEAKEAVLAWWQLTRRDNWYQIKDKNPRIAKIEGDGLAFLPKRMKLGETQFIRTFDRFILPDIKGAAWAQALFEYIHGEYRQTIDLIYKRNVLRRMFTHLKPGKIFDAGCGDGLANEEKPQGFELFGVDLVEEFVEAARLAGEEAQVSDLATMDITILPHGFNGAMMSFVDYWLTSDERKRTFRQLATILPQGGRFVFNVHLPEEDWQNHYNQLLRKAGFSQISFKDDDVDSKDGKKLVHLVIAEK